MADKHQLPKRVLIADLDSSSANLMSEALKKLGVPDIVTKKSGETALKELQSGTVELLIFDWKLSDLSGLQLLNRVRQEPDCAMIPILVTSGVIKQADFRLLDDFPLTRLVPKPLDNITLTSQLHSIWDEVLWYEKNTDTLNGAIQKIGEGTPTAVVAFKELLNASPHKIPLALLAVRILQDHNQLKIAEGLTKMILGIDPKCIMALNELGKVYHRMGKHQQAIEALKDALVLSPNNIERLCLLGENELKTNDLPAARGHFEKALEIDKANPKAVAGQLVVSNIEDYYKNRDPNETATKSFASLCNTIGITMVKSGRFDDGMKQYESAMHFAGSGQDAARVAYNLGLGFVRWKKPEQAHKWFQKSVEISGGTFLKAQELVDRVEVQLGLKELPPKAVPAGTTLKPSDAPEAPPDAFDSESFLDDFTVTDGPKADQEPTENNELKEDKI